jgi:multidrug efflux system membrane fusion protein
MPPIDSQTAKARSSGQQQASGQAGRGKGEGNLSRLNIAYPVEAAPVETQNIVYTVTAVGSVAAFETVQVTAKVPGVAERVLFSEGDLVSVGQVLAEIEPERYKLAVEAAQAAL